jgi:hypothetical protein
MPDLGGSLWLIIDVVLVAILAAALVFGIVQWRRRPRSPAVEQVRDEATRRGYDER